jgi:D-alanyl-D-alanine carboxypeptidase/D-alanyl-D-alanine-endopeptidase (penicillin-binding protein 4)
MIRNKKKLISVLIIVFAACNLSVFARSAASLDDFLKDDNLRHAAVGFKVVNLKSGETVASFNENMSLTPASNMKIVTVAAALITMQPSFRYKTSLLYSGEIKDSILRGDLYIRGVGDPTVGSAFIDRDKNEFLNVWLRAIQDRGIKQVEGDIIALDQLFGYEGYSMKWLLEDIGSAYAQGVYGISIFDNLHSREDIILDPGLFMAGYFKDFLGSRNISVGGRATTFRMETQAADGEQTDFSVPENLTEISSYLSPPLSEIVREINVNSNNHFAEHLYKKLTLIDSLNIKDLFHRAGIDSTALIMWDGSGLSPQNAVSANYITDLLAYMYKNYGGNKGAFYLSLPVAGSEGTVASFLKNTALSGKVRVKSGSMSGVQSFSGYIDKNGLQYAFSLIINNFNGKHKDIRKTIERFLLGIVDENGI